MNTVINYNLLEIAREVRRHTQIEASKLIGISQAKLSKAEKGLQRLPIDVLKKIAQVYDFPLAFFYRQDDVAPIGHMYFRRKVSISIKDMNTFIAKIKIYKLAIDELMSSVEVPEYKLGTYSTELYSPEDIAHKIRYILGIQRGRVPNLTTLLENHGIIVVKMDFDTEKLDGLASTTNRGLKIIFLNSQMSNDRLRFSLAHELGHLLMHIDTPPKFSEVAEDEANLFASEFLMPKEDILPHLYNISFSRLAELKRSWHVSMRSIVRRANDLDAIDKKQYRNLQIEFSRHRFNKKEPITLPTELPSIIEDTISLYKDELNYSDSNLMDIMLLNKADYTEWFSKKHRLVNLSKLDSHLTL